MYNLFGTDTNECSNGNTLPTFPPYDDDNYGENNNTDEDAADASNHQEQLPRAPRANAHVNTLQSSFDYDTDNEIFPIDSIPSHLQAITNGNHGLD